MSAEADPGCRSLVEILADDIETHEAGRIEAAALETENLIRTIDTLCLQTAAMGTFVNGVAKILQENRREDEQRLREEARGTAVRAVVTGLSMGATWLAISTIWGSRGATGVVGPQLMATATLFVVGGFVYGLFNGN